MLAHFLLLLLLPLLLLPLPDLILRLSTALTFYGRGLGESESRDSPIFIGNAFGVRGCVSPLSPIESAERLRGA